MSESPSPWSRASVSYEQRIVAYFDVLGWKDVIARAGHDPERLGRLRSMVGLYGYFQAELASDPQGSALTAFSDNVVMSRRHEAERVQEFIDNLGRHQVAAALNGFFVRGAVTVGPLFHDRTSVFGPALIEAHRLESTEARHPRIIVDPHAMAALGSPGHVRMMDGHWTVDAFGADFARDCLIPRVAAVTSSPSNPGGAGRRAGGEMVAIPAAPFRMVLDKVDAALAETTVEAARPKLLWLRKWVEEGIAALA